MPKISSTNKFLFIKFAIKSLCTTIISVVLLTAICSEVLLKLDIDLTVTEYIGFFICSFTAFLTAFVALSDFKNNYLLIAIISILPLVIFSLVNGILNKTSIVIIAAKIGLEIIFSIMSAIVKILRKRR